MEVGERPVHQVEVEILEAQIGKRLAARGNHIVFAVLVVPKLRGHPEFLALDAACQNRFKRCADFGLIAVDRSAIEMPVANRGRAANSLGNLRRRHVIGPECAQPDGRHRGAGIQHSCGIDAGSIEVGPFWFARFILAPC
jgi:hypothetical protein